MREVKHLIGGAWINGTVKAATVSPRDLSPFSSAPVGTEEDVNDAVLAAKRAAASWSMLSSNERAVAVGSLVRELRCAYGDANKPTELKTAIMDEVGKPFPEADLEVMECGDFTEYFCLNAPKVLKEKEIKINATVWPSKKSIVCREPIGVVGIIKPWNYPLEMIVWSLGPAILAGNTVVVKPSEKSPVSAMMLAELIQRTEIPPGVVNFVFGDRSTGQSVVAHPDIKMISFTGSVAAGRDVAIECARQLKKVSLELGGNDAAIVLRDVDIELAANGLVWGAFCNAGQVCVGIKRAYIADEVYDELKASILEKTQALVAGRDYGPIVDRKQLEGVMAFVKKAVDDGNRLLVGGRATGQGTFFEPTVIEITNKATELLSSECFGPLLPLIKCRSEEEAVNEANTSRYGLGASVWSKDLDHAKYLAEKVHAGMVWINDVNVAFPEAPWGGVRDSGIGFELSDDALLEYTNMKHVSVETGEENRRFWWYPYA